MGLDPFDYDELSRNVEDLLNDEYGVRDETFDVRLDGADLPDDPVEYRNAANGYGVQQPGGAPDFDEEAAAMRYDPQTNSGAAIRAYNTDYASRAAKRANRNPPPKARRTSDRADATQQLRLYGTFHRLLSPFEGNETAWMSVSPDRREAIFTFVRNRAIPNVLPSLVRLRGLDAGKRYRIEQTGEVYGGDALMNVGLCLPVLTQGSGDAWAALYTLKAVDEA